MNRMALTVACVVCSCVSMPVLAEDAPLPALPIAPAPSIDAVTDGFAPATDTTGIGTGIATGAETTVTPAAPTVTDIVPALPGANAAGTVNVPRLHVRSGPNADRYEIITTLMKDAPVTIQGENEGWYSIAYPSDSVCFIRSTSVQGEVPDVIPEGGVTLPVGQQAVDVRVRPWNQSTSIATLQPGANVTITSRKGRGSDEFYAIVPPAEARAWVKANYITRADTTTLPSSQVPQAGNLGPTATAQKKEPKSAVVTVEKPAESLVNQAYMRLQEEMARRQAEMERQRQAEIKKVEDELAAIERDTENRKNSITVTGNETPAAQQPITGWVEFTGRALKRPAAYRLIKGGQVLFLLRSSTVDLKDFADKLVAVEGTIEVAPGWEANILEVSGISLLAQGPIADDKKPVSTISSDQLEFLPTSSSTGELPTGKIPSHRSSAEDAAINDMLAPDRNTPATSAKATEDSTETAAEIIGTE